MSGVRGQGRDLPKKHVVEFAKPFEVFVDHRYVGTEALGDPRGIRPHDTPADDHDLCRRDARYASEQDAAPVVIFLEVLRANLY